MKGIKGIEVEKGGGSSFFCGNVEFVALSSVSRVSPSVRVRPFESGVGASLAVGPAMQNGRTMQQPAMHSLHFSAELGARRRN